MPVYRTPGVYLSEVDLTPRVIRGLETDIFAFIGPVPRGALGAVETVGSFHQYLRQCSLPTLYRDDMSRAIELFFAQGGNQARVVRVAQTGANEATLWIPGVNSRGTLIPQYLNIIASSPGAWANSLQIAVVNDRKNLASFSLLVVCVDTRGTKTLLEQFDDLSLSSRSSRFVETILASQSEYIRAKLSKGRAYLKSTMNDFSLTRFKGYEMGSAQAGEDGDPATITQYQNALSALLNTGSDIFTLCLPHEYWGQGNGSAIIQRLVSDCESSQRCQIIADFAQSIRIEHPADLSQLGFPESPYLCCYYPWINFVSSGTSGNQPDLLPPSSAAAGVWSRTDAQHGVWKAPAGIAAQLFNVSGLASTIDDELNGTLNTQGVNAVRQLSTLGIVLWGARTRAGSTDVERRYINVQRLSLFLKNSIQQGLEWAVFEPNDEPLWRAIRQGVSDFMQSLYTQGAFVGSSAKDAYFVRCGVGQTMTIQDVQNKVVNVVVGFAPLKPAEFIVENIQLKSV